MSAHQPDFTEIIKIIKNNPFCLQYWRSLKILSFEIDFEELFSDKRELTEGYYFIILLYALLITLLVLYSVRSTEHELVEEIVCSTFDLKRKRSEVAIDFFDELIWDLFEELELPHSLSHADIEVFFRKYKLSAYLNKFVETPSIVGSQIIDKLPVKYKVRGKMLFEFIAKNLQELHC